MNARMAMVAACGGLMLVPGRGVAAEAAASGDVAVRKSSGSSTRASGKDGWIHRYAPERNMGEIGVFGGILLPSRNLELFSPDRSLPQQGYKRFDAVAPDIGLRAGFYPLRFFGIEAEGAVMPTRTRDEQSAFLFAGRGHLVAQLGLWSVTPFVVAGATALGVSSPRASVGKDVDLAFHTGLGVKAFLNRWIALRLEGRDTVSGKRGIADGVTHSFELLLGVSVTLGRKPLPPPPPSDRDGDGFLDKVDACPDEPGVAPDGCPPRKPDRDGDGFLDEVDACPDEPGVAPDGCPVPDTDSDGFKDPDDKCVSEPETKNGYDDQDGCPDEVPAEVREFAGVMEGIYFDVDKATIKPASRPVLDKALQILRDHPTLSVEISGHTDSSGDDAYNLDLSRRRAEAVRKYMTDAGVEASRVSARGAGEAEPIADNETTAGKAKNRRIEFNVRK